MAIGNLTGKYHYREGENGSWVDFTTIAGVRVLAIDGFDERGEAVNVYTAQWIDSDVEDYMCAKQETTTTGSGQDAVTTTRDVIVRKNVDLNMTVIVSDRYTNANIDVQSQYDVLLSTICDRDIYLKSAYTNKIAHVVCLKSFKPTAVKIRKVPVYNSSTQQYEMRCKNSYILVTIPFHTLSAPENVSSGT